MTVTTRPLTELQQQMLAMRPSGPRSLRFPLVVGLLGWGLSLLGTLKILDLFFISIPPVDSLRWIFVVISLAWIVVVIILGRLPTEQQKLCRRDLEQGVAQIRTFLATEALQVTELDEMGSQYFIHLSDGRVLFLTSSFLAPEEKAKRFPCTEFDVVVAPHSQVIFGIDCRGDYFPPAKVLKPFIMEIPKPLELVKVPWDEIEAKYC